VPGCANVSNADSVRSFAPDGALPPPNAMPAGSYMADIQKRGRLIAGVSADTLLFGFQNPLHNNQFEGFDIDLIRRIAAAIFGNPNAVEFKVLNYAERIPYLQQDKVDIVADVMTITCARWKQIDFSSQYFEAGQRILVSTLSKANGIQDLNGKKVCVAAGSTNQDQLKKYPKVKAVAVPDISDCMVLFQQGQVDAVTGDDTVLAGFVQQDPYAKVVGPAFTEEPYGLGIKNKHPDFVRFVNAVLEDYRRNGWQASYNANGLTVSGEPPVPPAAQYGREP